MRRSGDQALDQALALHRAPGHLASIRQMELPQDMQTVLRIAAGDFEATQLSAQSRNESPQAVREAAIFYLQQLLFADEGDSYRALGVTADAPQEQIKLHHRLLVRWLHPDRNPDEWESVFADRVNRAWQDLRSPDRRSAYDLAGAASDLPVAVHGIVAIPTVCAPPMARPVISARIVRWLPTMALGGIALVAVVALVMFQRVQVTTEAFSPDVVQLPTDDSRDGLTSTGSVAATVPAASAVALIDPPTQSMPSGSVLSADVEIPAGNPPDVVATAASTAVEPEAKHPIESVAISAVAQPSAQTSDRAVIKAKPAAIPALAIAYKTTSTPATITNQSPARAIAAAPVPVALPGPKPVTEPAAPARFEAVTLQPAQPGGNATTPVETVSPGLIDDRIAASLVSRFSQAYANGDTEQLMQLFTDDAQNGSGDRQAIAQDYRRLFESSTRRRIALSDLSWLTVGDGATIIASFDTEVVLRGKNRGQRVSGNIRFDLREENGELRIYRLSHANRRS